MTKQVELHNEVILVGKIMNCQRNVSNNKIKAIKVKLAIPNDDAYQLDPNYAFVYFKATK